MTLSSLQSRPRPAIGSDAPAPATAGVGLRSPHLEQFASGAPAAGWVEIHSENYIGIGGLTVKRLHAARANYPVSCHGVGLSLGSTGGLDRDHLARLSDLFDRIDPFLISEHVSWSSVSGVYMNDLLPLPYTEEALAVICSNIDHAQEVFGRQILVENPSSYLSFIQSEMSEEEFLSEIVSRTGCGLLLDINNIVVSVANNGGNATSYLHGIPAEAVGEIHVAGHLSETRDGCTVLIDDHGSAVPDAVWDLYEDALELTGPTPTLVEWDTNIPPLDALLAEAAKAQLRLDSLLQDAAHAR